MDYSKLNQDYDECIEKLKEAILEQSRISGKLINPLNSDSKNVLGIMCTWNQMFKAMELAEKEWKRTNPVYWKDGNAYRKLKRNEVIAEGAMQSYCNGELNPCLGIHTVGDTPSSFSDDRDFYNPVSMDNPYKPVIKKLTKICKDLNLCCKACGEVLKQDWTDLKKPMYCNCKK